jgi:hypothetical protein
MMVVMMPTPVMTSVMVVMIVPLRQLHVLASLRLTSAGVVSFESGQRIWHSLKQLPVTCNRGGASSLFR